MHYDVDRVGVQSNRVFLRFKALNIGYFPYHVLRTSPSTYDMEVSSILAFSDGGL